MIYDTLSRFLFPTPAATTLTGAVTLTTLGSSYTIAVTSGVGFPNGATILVSETTHNLTGVITSGGGTTSLVVTSTVQSATSGTIATSGSSVVVTGMTSVNDAGGSASGATITLTNPSAALDTVTGGVGLARPMVASIRYNAARNASGSNTVIFTVQKSTDGITYYDFVSGASEVLTLTTTAQAGVVNLRFNTTQEFIRINVTVGGTGSTPTITIVSADLTYAAL